MQTKTYDVYKYDELPEKVQDKVIEKQWDINVDSDFWYDYDGKTGFSSKEIEKYRLGFEHSDDLLTYKKLYFDIDRDWYIQFVDAQFKHDETARKFLGIPKRLWDETCFRVNDQPGRYGNTRLEYEEGYNREKDFTAKQIEILDRAVERFADKIEEALRNLQNGYEYLTSREAIEETIRLNEYDFTLDGDID